MTGTLHSEKLGVTTTVKEQVENIEVTLANSDCDRPFQAVHRPAKEATE